LWAQSATVIALDEPSSDWQLTNVLERASCAPTTVVNNSTRPQTPPHRERGHVPPSKTVHRPSADDAGLTAAIAGVNLIAHIAA
jgi:hypothetical protein